MSEAEKKKGVTAAVWCRNHLWVLFFLTLLTVALNAGTRIAGLYQDDLYLWVRFANHRALGYIFQTGTSRFRFIWELICYIVLKLSGTHTEWLVPVNMLANGLVAWIVYLIARRMSGSVKTGFLAGIAYVVSRFSYYQISMVLGLMETTSLLGAILLLFALYGSLMQGEKGKKRNFLLYTACFLYFVTVFIHERYMALVVLLMAVLWMEREQKKLWIPLAEFALIQLIRLATIGTLSPPGTAGTNIADTFEIGKAFGFAWQQVFYLFGINTGNAYLSGISFGESSRLVQFIILLSILFLLTVVVFYIIAVVRSEKKERGLQYQVTALFFLFIALCIGSSSVTVRVEMRWVYVSYTAALCYAAHMCGYIEQKQRAGCPKQMGKGMKQCLIHIPALCFLAYVCCMAGSEGYARQYRTDMYYYSNQRRMNSLADVTVGKYGEAFFEKQVYVLKNEFGIDEWTWENFFRVYRKDKKPAIPQIQVVNGVEDFGLVGTDMLILAEDSKDNTYVDVTEFVKNQKLERISGCYEDGWLDQRSEFMIQAGKSGEIHILFYYPYERKGNEIVTVYRDNTELFQVNMDDSHKNAVIYAQPYEKVHIRTECNFIVENAGEKRGKDELAVVAYFDIP